MVISPYEVIEQGIVIKNNPAHVLEGAGIDLSLDGLFSIEGSNGYGVLGQVSRKTPNSVPLTACDDDSDWYSLYAFTYVLAVTLEEVRMPHDVTAFITPRSTLYRSGVKLHTGNVAPGYHGPLTFGFETTEPFLIERGARFAHIVFHEVAGPTAEYRGQWQGGRISQPESEVQV